jgi:hypothetical protein
MAENDSDPTRDKSASGQRSDFDFFSNEYAQAVEAFSAIESQSSTIAGLGASDDFRSFIDQFIEMAARIKALADDRKEPHFAEWFEELIERAEALRTEIVEK